MPLSGGASNATPIGPLPTSLRSRDATPRLSAPIALVSVWASADNAGTAASTAPASARNAPRRSDIVESSVEVSSGIIDAGLRAGSSGGSLYVVATPIGHLSDLGTRAAEVLRSVDVVAAEDTRTSRVLLEHVGSRAIPIAAH